MRKELNNIQLSAFCRQMSMLLESGLTLYDGIGVLSEDIQAGEEKDLYSCILSCLDSGMNFSRALKQSEAFPEYMTEMTAIGEVSGNLEKTMLSLSSYYETREEIHDNVNNRVKYPRLMVMMMLIVIAVLTGKVLPVFSKVYEQLGLRASALSRTVLRTSSLMTAVIIGVIAVVSAVLAVSFILSCSDKGKNKLKNILKKLPFTKSVYTYLSCADFALGMNLMLSSGLDIITSVDMAGACVSDDEVKKKVETISKLMEKGTSFEGAVALTDVFSHTEEKMLLVAGKSGNTESMLAKLAKDYLEKAYGEINRKIRFIEPCIVTSFSVFTGIILLSVVIPLMSVVSGMM